MTKEEREHYEELIVLRTGWSRRVFDRWTDEEIISKYESMLEDDRM